MFNKKWLIAVLSSGALLLIFIAMAGGFTSKIKPAENSHAQAANQQPVTAVIEREIAIVSEYPGHLIAKQTSVLSSRISAQVVDVLADVGARVKQGDIIMRLANQDLDARRISQQESLAAAQAQLNKARLEHDRVIALVNEKLLPEAERDRVVAQLDIAQANLKQANAALSEAQASLGYSLIAAPYDGIISKRWLNLGDQANVGAALVSLYNPNDMQLSVNIPESVIKAIKLGQRWPLQVASQEQQLFATVVEIAPAADLASHSFLVKLDIEPSLQPLLPGMFARLQLTTGYQPALLVDSRAVYRVGQIEYVKALNEQGVALPAIVRTGKQLDEYSLVRSGLSAGAEVLINP
ncbi:efflux RND transporter periplasmic adaptor subunit [Reinekea thalattae]|uniref:Efflux RND transporter periplasmic adaptor subunit n=1 Tax=Reinekea thalattae TaxID=2593301 RepID=A0A5C8ZA25_9GAMM|nr:efflux RND transporter periplasmic adaptor subunit [Reinekea thalattae]TXR54129.1 efflux RND transporter periplasmic adaptor subunit [Reinekea thalattae]